MGSPSWQTDDRVFRPRRPSLRRGVPSSRIPSGLFIPRQNCQLLGPRGVYQNIKLRQGHRSNQVITLHNLAPLQCKKYDFVKFPAILLWNSVRQKWRVLAREPLQCCLLVLLLAWKMWHVLAWLKPICRLTLCVAQTFRITSEFLLNLLPNPAYWINFTMLGCFFCSRESSLCFALFLHDGPSVFIWGVLNNKTLQTIW